MVFGVMIVDEGRGMTLEGKTKDYVSGVSSHITPHKRYCGIVVWVCKIPGLRNVEYIYISAGFVFLTTLFDSGWNNFN